jgi:CheY-like chemotaxis protein
MAEQGEFEELQVLIASGRPHTVQLLRQVLTMLGIRRATAVAQSQSAIELLRGNSFAALFCDEQLTDAEAEAFVLAARRTPGLVNPMIPIFLVCTGPKRRTVEAARDLGFTDVLARPLSATTVRRKLRSALVQPRPFIVAGEFFGPDRRAGSKAWKGGERRKRQPRKVRVATPSDVEYSSD